MEATDLTIEILKDIRADVRRANERLDTTIERLDTTVERLDSTNHRLDELSRRVVEADIRTSTAIVDLAGAVHEMTSTLRNVNDLRPRVERCEQDIASLKRRPQ